MDFALGRFLEMFEARFGRVAGTVLLALIGLALATFTGRLILSGLILPIYEAVNAMMNGHGDFMTLIRNFSVSRLNPFFSATLWIVMISWFVHNLAHDGYALAKRRRVMRDAESRFAAIIDRVKAFRWIKENQADAKEMIARLDNEANGVGPVVDNAFLYGPRDLPSIAPPPTAVLAAPERDD